MVTLHPLVVSSAFWLNDAEARKTRRTQQNYSERHRLAALVHEPTALVSILRFPRLRVTKQNSARRGTASFTETEAIPQYTYGILLYQPTFVGLIRANAALQQTIRVTKGEGIA